MTESTTKGHIKSIFVLHLRITLQVYSGKTGSCDRSNNKPASPPSVHREGIRHASTLAVELIEPGVRLITLQRPQALNALTTQLLGELADELSAAQADPQTRAVSSPAAARPRRWRRHQEMAERDLVGILDDPRRLRGKRSPASANP
jgi:hypothetical protein